MVKNILVTGGAGYIGSQTVKDLCDKGFNVIVLDNLSKGHEKSIPERAKFIHADLSDIYQVIDVLNQNNIDAVMHFAAYSIVGESVEKPELYFQDNIVNGINLLNAMVRCNVKFLVFSSSAAVYGEPDEVPIKEGSQKEPTNPYGLTKLQFEQILDWYDQAHNLKFISLRYFNAAGADPSAEIGEDHSPETHLIPIILDVALEKRKQIKIFGTDYDTEDGTCVRDYIHVKDISDAHILALQYIFQTKQSNIYNLGNGKGYSVKEIIERAKEITQKPIPVVEDKRRPGDPATLIADYSKIQKDLDWNPKFGIKEIIETAWNWHKNNPDGYK